MSDLGPRALALSLPFSCILGLVSSLITSTMVSKSYMWAYATFQYAIVILFAHIFYTLLSVNPILSVLLSSFTGFGIAISTNSLIVEYLRWRSSRNPNFSHQHFNGGAQPQQQQQQPHQNQQEQQELQQQQQNRQQQSIENLPVGPTDDARLHEMRI